MTSRKKTPGDYEVGYGKPPVHTRFAKGQSGNPSGRPKAGSFERAKALVLEEAYRTLVVKEESGMVPLPALQAIVRSQIALAAKGHGPAQRAVIAAVQAIEEERAIAAGKDASDTRPPMSDIEVARRICFLLDLGEQQEQRERAAAAAGEATSTGGAVAPEPQGGDGE